METRGNTGLSGAARGASLALKGAVVLLALWGQYLGFLRAGYVAAGHFLYFTNISNILCAAGALVFFVYEARRAQPPMWLLHARLAYTAGIALVFIVFSLLLSPLMSAAYLASRDNLVVHNLLPMLCVLDFILFGHGYAQARRRPLAGLVTPLLYYALTFALSRTGRFFGRGSRFPYFFLDDAANGWFTVGGGRLGVFWWMLLMTAAQLGISAGLVFLQGRVHVAAPGEPEANPPEARRAEEVA
ncbi:MAG TPA: Pr6Pr family membrane protein [Candidatus Limnocylindria bacterium]|nr:Pr6Pr family membrane protein [Candidatus Limnocylindria bacterium]